MAGRWIVLLLALTISQSGLAGVGVPTSAWKKALKDVPNDARATLTKVLECQAFGGDELDSKQQTRWKKLGCDTVDAEVAKLREKVPSNSKVIDLLNCAQEKAAATNCPE